MPGRSETRVFISRQPGPGSPFHSPPPGLSIEGHSLLSLKKLDFRLPDKTYDWIFFLSRFGFDCFEPDIATVRNRNPHARIAAFGPGTARHIISKGFAVDFIGTGAAAPTLELFKALADQKSVLLPSASDSRDSIYRPLSQSARVDKLVVYTNTPDPTRVPMESYDIWIFTSPLNVRSYLLVQLPDPLAQYIALDPPTAAELQDFEGLRLITSAQADEEALYASLLIAWKTMVPPSDDQG